MTQPTSTANYRKYPKGPNFNLIVLLSGVAIIVILLGAMLCFTLTSGGCSPATIISIQPPSSFSRRPVQLTPDDSLARAGLLN